MLLLLCCLQEEYNILNLAFYFFLNNGLSLWAFGLRINKHSDATTPASPFLSPDCIPAAALAKPGFNLGDLADYFLLAVGPLTLGLYYLGAAELHTKVPIYIMMSTIFSVLTWRFWQVRRAIIAFYCLGFMWIPCYLGRQKQSVWFVKATQDLGLDV